MVRFVAGNGALAGVRPELDSASLRGARRRPERGAHVHPRQECLSGAEKRGFARSFRRGISAGATASQVAAAAQEEAFRILTVAKREGVLRAGPGEGLLLVATDAPDVTHTPEVAAAINRGDAIALADREGLGRWLGTDPIPLAHIERGSLATSLTGVWAIRNAVRPYGVAAAEDG